MDQPCIIILAAPSGSGKTSIAARLMALRPTISFSVSATTRPPRAHETSGVHYHFMDVEEFESRRANGELLESEEVYPGCWYGTLRSEVEKSNRNAPVLLDIDVIGALRVKKQYQDRCLAIFVSPPSLDVLKHRLEARGTETPESLKARIGKAATELEYADAFDFIVVNDELDQAVREVIQLVDQFVARS